MYEDFAPRLARILTEYSVPIREGELVIIEAPLVAEPLAVALYEAVLRCGAHPVIRTNFDLASNIFMKYATDAQLEYVTPMNEVMIDQMDVRYYIKAATNTKAATNVDPARITTFQKARKHIIERYKERENAGEIRWNICAWPTQAAAQEAEMSLLDYTEFVYKACGLDHEDPVAYWQEFKERQERYIGWLAGKETVEVRGPGIDLSMSVKGRTWINACGDANFPDGEIFTSPVEDSVNGTVEFNYPTNYGGRRIEGVRLVYRDGKVVEASAAKGEDYLLSQLDFDEGSRILGEFAIGTNWGIQQFTGDTLFDEKIGGTVHMAVGRGFHEAGSQNMSAVHWDMVHGMTEGGEIIVDGETMYKNGKFLIDEETTK
jgi:aminopeptidase